MTQMLGGLGKMAQKQAKTPKCVIGFDTTILLCYDSPIRQQRKPTPWRSLGDLAGVRSALRLEFASSAALGRNEKGPGLARGGGLQGCVYGWKFRNL
jgi:hypothetical protein